MKGSLSKATDMAASGFWIDGYNDIYSDFDSRHYQSRRISEDFLHELHTDMHHRRQAIEELLLVLPADKRMLTTEVEIAESLGRFFKAQYHLYRYKCHRKLRTSILMGTAGVTLLLLDAGTLFLGIRSLITTLLSTIIEPASWFLLWTSVDYLIYDWKDLKKEQRFYKDLSEARIRFQTA